MVEIKNNTTPVKIICPVHGIFEQTPKAHRIGGCRKCADENNKKTLKYFIDESNKKHKKFYNYTLVKYNRTDGEVIIGCPIHGNFEQQPSSHIKGAGCPDCANNTFTQDKVICQFVEAHGNRYDYSLVKYKNDGTKVDIICRKHGIFPQRPSHHKKGQNCPLCAKELQLYGLEVYRNKKTTLYYVKVNNLYKIGLTLSDVLTRFNTDIRKGVEIKIIKTWSFENGIEAYNAEQDILSEYINYQYKGDKILHGGNTELFTKDVLSIDN